MCHIRSEAVNDFLEAGWIQIALKDTLNSAGEQTRHTLDSQGQILALT